MNVKNTLSFEQFLAVKDKLTDVSDTWSDLWALIFYTDVSVGRLISLRFDYVNANVMLLQEHRHLKELRVELSVPAVAILNRRREKYPDDIFVFQSHSNRVKYERRPVTLIAFNTALSRAAKSLPNVTVSSSSARRVHRYTPQR